MSNPHPQIIYMLIVGPVMLAALLEWFLWLAAFCYCLAKAYSKSQRWSERVLAILMIILFVAMRCATTTMRALSMLADMGAGAHSYQSWSLLYLFLQ